MVRTSRAQESSSATKNVAFGAAATLALLGAAAYFSKGSKTEDELYDIPRFQSDTTESLL